MKKIIAIALMLVSASVLARPEYTCVMKSGPNEKGVSVEIPVDTANGNKVYSKQKGLDVYSVEFEPGYVVAVIIDPLHLDNATQVQFKNQIPTAIMSGTCEKRKVLKGN